MYFGTFGTFGTFCILKLDIFKTMYFGTLGILELFILELSVF